ncbi:MAG: hypothetical protein AAFO91_09600, partial [Bacteroidota bacterium]
MKLNNLGLCYLLFMGGFTVFGQSFPVPNYHSIPLNSDEYSVEIVNNYPVFSLDFRPEATIELSLPAHEWQTLSIYTVYQSNSPEEQTIWSIDPADGLEEILSTQRVANLTTGQWHPLLYRSPLDPHLVQYFRLNPDSVQGPFSFRLGKSSGEISLPSAQLNGWIGETLLYNRMLTLAEQQMVCTYLALKYGLTLFGYEGAVWLGGEGNSLWNRLEADNFRHRIAGFGLDHQSGLRQWGSTSVYAPDMIRIELSDSSEFANFDYQQYVLWGDNNAPLNFGSPDEPSDEIRTWRYEYTGPQLPPTINLSINARRWNRRANGDDIYWVQFYPFSNERTALEGSQFYPASDLSEEDQVSFQNIHLPTESPSGYFSFLIGPELMGLYETECSEQENTLHIRAIGGRPPYQF